MRRIRRALLGAACAVLLAPACGNGGSNFGDAGGGDAGDDLTVDAPGLDGQLFGDVPGNDGNCARTCSSDLHSVIDCNANVVQTCSGTDGCDVATGACVNACQAAVDNKNSVGCEYYATDLHSDDGAGVCYAAFVANTWNTPAHINVEYNGSTLPVQSFALLPQGKGQSITYTPYNATNGLQPNEVVILVEYMSGSQWSQMKDLGGYGDPDLSIVIPPAQYLSHYVFMTDPTYPETNLVVIRRADANDNFQDVNLDCAGNLPQT